MHLGVDINLAPTWEELAQSLDESLGVSVGKIDCTLHKGVCNEFEVKGYPTMLWIEDGKKIEKYQGARSLNDLKDYVLRKSSSDNKGQTAAPVVSESSPVLSLTGSSFDSSIDTGVTFVKFYAPWCGHCKRMATTWEDLAQKFKENPSVQIAKVDCTLEENKELCSAQEVNGFPTVFIYRDGEKITEYNGSRSLDDLYQFVLKHSEAKDKDEL
ncbi:thioredoxin domain-containing protein 5 [Neocloeon triangulifer]|uniref:thioredoxin domain-containing protein 5 n=1 Tax=Neocloeon triangulifer TaxID=2078957 RepID=UPI00286EF262|nr:thioredoxin domain-containing protein 5 [Neocloeon triangulifer]